MVGLRPPRVVPVLAIDRAKNFVENCLNLIFESYAHLSGWSGVKRPSWDQRFFEEKRVGRLCQTANEKRERKSAALE